MVGGSVEILNGCGIEVHAEVFLPLKGDHHERLRPLRFPLLPQFRRASDAEKEFSLHKSCYSVKEFL